MLRLSKMTDYGVLLMSELAKSGDATQRAPDLAEATFIPQPTVRKIMTTLIQNNLVESVRGINGGYKLQRTPQDINVRELIRSLEGDIALTGCEEAGNKACEQAHVCGTRTNWLKINQAVCDALQNISLKDMVDEDFTPIFNIKKVVPIRAHHGMDTGAI